MKMIVALGAECATKKEFYRMAFNFFKLSAGNSTS